MFIKIPFESTLDFKTNIYEITKMSLEHDYNVNEGVILGNFYISGEYRSHEVSVNQEPFKFTLPFTVELRDDIDIDTLEFNIEDFSYNIMDDHTLKVNIEYSISAEERKEKLDPASDTFTEVADEELDREMTELADLVSEESSTTKEEDTPVNAERTNVKEEKTVMETIKDSDDTFVTYHVHFVKENETIESIATLYNIPSSLINEYNNVESPTKGDKILIPKVDE